jgi:hypothetical protein
MVLPFLPLIGLQVQTLDFREQLHIAQPNYGTNREDDRRQD